MKEKFDGERQPGYYRVKIKGAWRIASYMFKKWRIAGIGRSWNDNELDQIDPMPINPEPQEGGDNIECYILLRVFESFGIDSSEIIGIFSDERLAKDAMVLQSTNPIMVWGKLYSIQLEIKGPLPLNKIA